MQYEDIIKKKKYPEGYPEDSLDVLQKMSFTNGKALNIIGSMQMRSQLYAGDYDAMETVKTHGNTKVAVRKLALKFKSIVRKLLKTPNLYISDIKCGSIEEWIVVDKKYDNVKSREKLKELFDSKVITQEQYDFEYKLLKPLDKLNRIELLFVRNEIRHNIIRWKPKEVLKGYKILVDGRKFRLEDAFQTPTITKLDVVAWVQNNRYTDFSCIYEFVNKGKVLNPRKDNDLHKAIYDNIQILKADGNYFKMAKRIFVLARLDKNKRAVELLSAMFTGDLGRLYHVYSDIGTLENLFEIKADVPLSELRTEIDQFKGRLSNIIMDGYLRKEDDIVKKIEKAESRESMLKILGELKDDIYKIMSSSAKTYMIKHKIMALQSPRTRRSNKRAFNKTFKNVSTKDY
jgi:hypothetical protein